MDENATQDVTADSKKVTEQETADVPQDDAASIVAPSTASSTRKRRWFGGSKDMKNNTPINTAMSSASNLNAESSSPTGPNTSGNASSRPVSIQNSRNASFSNAFGGSSYDTYSSSPRQRSTSSSQRRRRGSGTGGSGDGDSLSIRKREIEEAQDRLDRWGARATGGTERAERELGLGDDVNMALS